MTERTNKPAPSDAVQNAEAPARVQPLAGVKGMNDMLPTDAPLWESLEEIVRDWTHAYGYRQIRTPIVENTALFARGLGAATDVVEKEMYSFVDALNGEHLTLRPENTAGVVRAVIEHNLTYNGPQRLWYMGPMFRHERPQRGRYRQFHQIGVEAIGFEGPDIDVEIIAMSARLWEDLGLTIGAGGLRLEINSIGDPDERKAHRAELIAYFEQHADQLDEDARRRLHANPLRILDTKNPAMQALVENAPKLVDHLGEASRAHFEGVQSMLRELNIPFKVNPRLVRGLDYYNRTVFEWVTDQLGAQGTVCGGGRFDPLVQMMGGKPTPACGFAIGMERLLELIRNNADMTVANRCDVYVINQGDRAKPVALKVAEMMRSAGLAVITHCGEGGFKSQFKKADASGATVAVILGDDEAMKQQAAVKWLRTEDGRPGEQRTVPLARLVDTVVDAVMDGEEDGDEDDEDDGDER